MEPQFQLNTHTYKQSILTAIDKLPFLDQTTNTPEALKYMRTTMFTSRNGDRPGAPNVAIVITGRSALQSGICTLLSISKFINTC